MANFTLTCRRIRLQNCPRCQQSLPFMKWNLPRLCLFFLLVGLAGCRVQNNPPELTGISPDSAFVGEAVKLTGYQFGSDPVVTLGSGVSAVVAKLASHDERTIQITVPLIAPGMTTIRVGNDEGVSDPLPFTVLQPPPVLTAITPGNGLPGSTVVLTGSYLNQLLFIRFGNLNVVVKDSSAGQLTVTLPADLPRGPLPVVIETAGGQLMGRFIVAGTPQITGLSTKVAKPGSPLIITGTNLTDGVIRVNGFLANTSQTTIKDTEIRTVIPDNATSGRVTVTVFEQLVATSVDSVQIVQQPFITSLSARDGITGDKLLLNGRALRDITAVSMGTTAVPFRIVSDTQLEVTIPAFAASGSLAVTASGPGGTATAADTFFYYLAPSAVTFSPVRQVRGQPITISGKDLYRITEVRVSGQSVPITNRTEGTDLLVNVPANAVSGPITVVNRAGTATSSLSLVVVQKPVITDIIPRKARPGERVVLRGSFLLNAQIIFTGSAAPAPDGGKNEDAERWVLVPTDAQTGPIRITNITSDQTLTDAFTVLRLASVIDFTPKTAKVGDVIVITGQNITSATEVRFGNGTSSPAAFTVDGAALRVTVPTGAVTGQICLTNEAGLACSSANFTVTK